MSQVSKLSLRVNPVEQTENDPQNVELSTSVSGREQLAAGLTALFVIVCIFAIVWNADSRSVSRTSKAKTQLERVANPNSPADSLNDVRRRKSNILTPNNTSVVPAEAAVAAPKQTNIEPTTWLDLNDADIKFLFMLMATVFGAWVAYLGHRFNLDHNKRSHALQVQSEKRLNAEADRTAQAKELELQNQKTETLVKWVQLLGCEDKLAHLDQRVAASLVLAKSGMVEIALTYLDSVWRKKPIAGEETDFDAGCAVAVINEGLASKNETLQDLAAMILEYHAKKLSITTEGKVDYFWPNVVEWRWKPELTVYARLAIWQALGNALVTHKFELWHEGTLRGAFVTFHAAMTQDPSDIVKHASAKVAKAVLERFGTLEVLLTSEQKYCDRQDVLAEIEAELAKSIPKLPTAVSELLHQIEAWCNEKSTNPGDPAVVEMKGPVDV
jgi:hypothetical protein